MKLGSSLRSIREKLEEVSGEMNMIKMLYIYAINTKRINKMGKIIIINSDVTLCKCVLQRGRSMFRDISETIINSALILSQNAFKFYFIYRIHVNTSNGNFKVRHPNTAQFKAGGI